MEGRDKRFFPALRVGRVPPPTFQFVLAPLRWAYKQRRRVEQLCTVGLIRVTLLQIFFVLCCAESWVVDDVSIRCMTSCQARTSSMTMSQVRWEVSQQEMARFTAICRTAHYRFFPFPNAQCWCCTGAENKTCFCRHNSEVLTQHKFFLNHTIPYLNRPTYVGEDAYSWLEMYKNLVYRSHG